MTQVILNIGLDPPSVALDYRWNHHERLARSLEECRVRFNQYQGLVRMNNLIQTLIVVGTLPGDWQRTVSDMAMTLNQDCIAAWDMERGEGSLHGAFASHWQPFRRDLFVFPEEAGWTRM
jgi:hypothetical protein